VHGESMVKLIRDDREIEVYEDNGKLEIAVDGYIIGWIYIEDNDVMIELADPCNILIRFNQD